MNLLAFFICFLLAINIATFFIYGFDKLAAKKHWQRVSELALLLWAAFGGSIGALLGMRVWHHKTQHKKFIFGLPLLLVLHVLLYTYFMRYF